MTIVEKLRLLASPTPSRWREKALYRRKNSYWLRRSMRIAYEVLTKLDELGMTQSELAQRMGCTFEKVKNIVKGRENLSLEIIVRLEDVLGIHILTDMCSRFVSDKEESCTSEIASQEEEYVQRIDQVKTRFHLAEESFVDTSFNDNIEEILAKAYSHEAKLIAKSDTTFHLNLDKLTSGQYSSTDYREELIDSIRAVTAYSPDKDPFCLARSVMHRKMLLDWFEKIVLDPRNKNYQSSSILDPLSNIEGRLLPSQRFMLRPDSFCKSNLWLLNEEYLCFMALDKPKLKDVTFEGRPLFTNTITCEEERFIQPIGEETVISRPDIFIFPQEHKCVIIEINTTSLSLAHHIDRIRRYAYLLRNFTTADVILDTFYGYLIGDAFDTKAVRVIDGDFDVDPGLGHCRRRNIKVAFEDDSHRDGCLDIEVIPYSSILQRAKIRNEVLINRLTPSHDTKENQKSEIGIDPK